MNKKIIGVTGGVGCGKSTILSILKRDYSATIIEMDAVGKKLQQPGGICYEAICERFGEIEDLLLADGTINRAKLAQVVFQDKAQLDALNGIVHPAVRNYVNQQIDLFLENDAPYLVLESAILYEAGYEPVCDEIWIVTVEKEVQIARLMASRQYTRARCEAVMENQSFDALLQCVPGKVHILHNTGSLKETEKEIKHLLNI
jgi:dephospho-CoA kinase